MADKVTVGNVEILTFLDMLPPLRDPASFFPGVSTDDWAPYKADFLENDQLQLYFGCFLLRSQGKTILVDTGAGPGPHPAWGDQRGTLVDQLRGLGIVTDDVNFVVHTHLHPDHVGWNLKLVGGIPAPYFRRARYLVPRLDWEHFTQPERLDSSPHIKTSVMPLQRLRLMELVDGDHNVTDEVTTLFTPGHTPGHQSVLISSQGEKAMVVGDVMHSMVQVQEPGWCPGVDADKDQSQRSREELLDRAEKEGYVVAAGHFPPSHNFGKIVRLEGRRYWQAL